MPSFDSLYPTLVFSKKISIVVSPARASSFAVSVIAIRYSQCPFSHPRRTSGLWAIQSSIVLGATSNAIAIRFCVAPLAAISCIISPSPGIYLGLFLGGLPLFLLPVSVIMGYQSDAYEPVGVHTTNSSLASAVTLTRPSLSSYPNANQIRLLQIQAFSQNVRYTLDGTTPTASVGFQLLAGQVATFGIDPATVVSVIQEAASASVQYQWFR